MVERSVESQVREQLLAEGACFLNKEQQDALTKVVATATNTLNPKIVGKSPKVIAEMAGITIPERTRVMICELSGVGRDYPLSMEKLSPILAYYVVENLEEGCERCAQILRYGGMGHTASIHTQSRDAAREYGIRMPASRVVVNSPSTHGAIGFTTDLEPSMTLGCGSWGGNVTSDNISPRHLVDIKRIAFETRPINQAVAPSVRVAAQPAAAATIGRAEIAALVDRFLAERHVHQPTKQGSTQSSTPPTATPFDRPPQNQPLAQPASPAPPNGASNGQIYDFVCEEDVKRAIASREKININSKTIITPAARELAEERDVFMRP